MAFLARRPESPFGSARANVELTPAEIGVLGSGDQPTIEVIKPNGERTKFRN